MKTNLSDILKRAVGYDTPLNAQQQPQYDQWRARLPEPLQNTADYDLQGAYLDSAQTDHRLHMTDKFKKPNHMTFSDGSQYSTPEQMGGRWVDTWARNPYDPAGNSFVFWASPENLKQHPLSALDSYFQNYEKGNTMVAPFNYRLPRR